MKRFSKFLMLGMALALIVGVVALPALAQEGEGGTIVVSNIGDDPSTFNPIVGADTTSSSIYGRMYPTLLANDPVTLEPAPNAAGGLATGWSYDETGTILTVTLREDAFWSDGEQITADDYLWGYAAVESGQTSSPRTSSLWALADGTVTEGVVHGVSKLDDFTLQFELGTVERDENGEIVLAEDGTPALLPNCVAINEISAVAVVPEHAFSAQFGEDYAAMDNDPYFVPEGDGGFATFGAFTDPFIEFGVQTSLIADQNYPDTQLGYVSPGEWLLQSVEDTTVGYERFLAGDFTTYGISADNQNSFRERDEGFQIIEYPSNGYTYMGYNLADPNNPQAGRDENGELVDQGLHPIFGDVMVRQALAYAVNVREIIGTRPDGDAPATGILEGNGFPQATHNHPGLSSVDPGVEPYPFEPETAAAMLEEAGWVDADGDGVRECQGCLYATEVDASFEGSPMEFELLTNAGNNIREATGETIRAQLADVGVTVNFQAIEFGTLVDELLGQQFDAIIIGWSLGIPFDAGSGTLNLFGIGNDRPGAGFNFMSYGNPEMEELLLEGDSLGAAEDGSYGACDETVRNELYAEALRMMYEDPPYLWLFAGNSMTAAQGTLENFDPLPYNTTWNEDAWAPGE